MKLSNKQKVKNVMCLKDVRCEMRDSSPIHYILRLNAGLLGAARWPAPEPDWNELYSIGFRWVICAASVCPGYDPFPLEFLERIELTDLIETPEPEEPDVEFDQIAAIASKAYSKLEGGGILVHCAGGRGRTGTIIGRILCRHCGYGSAEVRCLLNTLYQRVGKPGWPESDWQAKVIGALQAPG